MVRQIQILIDEDVYNRLQALMVSPAGNVSAVIRELLQNEECPQWGAEAQDETESNLLHPAELEHPVQEINEEY